MTQSDLSDELMYFPWSGKRGKIFESVLEEPRDLRTIKNQTELPRTTIRDNLHKMESLGWVETTEQGTYRTTPTGRAAHGAFQQYRDSIRVINRFEPFFEYVDPGTLAFDWDLLLDAEMITPTEKRPMAPSAKLSTLAAESSHFRGFLAVVEPSHLVGNTDRITSGDLTYELVADPRVLSRLDDLYGVPESPPPAQADIYVFRKEFPFGLAIFDERTVTLSGFHHTEGRTVLVESSNQNLVEWGVETFDRFRGRATPVSHVEAVSRE